MAVLRKCVCCGKEYEYCPNCGKNSKPAWMVTFCGEDCKELFNIVSAYNMKLVSKAKVQAFVAEHGITDFQKFEGPIRKVLEEASVAVVNQEPAKEPQKVSAVISESIWENSHEKTNKTRSPLRSSLRRKRKHNL